MDTLPPSCPDDKFCKGCGQSYPPTLEFFPPEKKGKNGLSSRCRFCTRAKYKKYRDKPEVREHRNAHMKNWHSNPENREKQRVYYGRPDIREHANAYHRNYRRRPHARKRIKLYYQRAEVRRRIQAYYSQPEQKERKRLRTKFHNSIPAVQERQYIYRQSYNNRPEVKQRKHAWHQARYSLPETRARMRAIRHRRRARLKNALGSHTGEEVRAQFDRQRGTCYYCRKSVSWENFHLDHVVPLSRGGTNDISNLVVSCPSCNLKKRDKLPHEFFEGGRLL